MSVLECLTVIGVSVDQLSSCSSISQEFTIIKKEYFKQALLTHPDKGGDATKFKLINNAFESLRSLLDQNSIKSFISKNSSKLFNLSNVETRSYEFYAQAAQEPFPIYHVELARSNRSRCSMPKCASKWIDKGCIRIGSINETSGTYGRWIHLNCWRVPSRIWLGLPDSLDEAEILQALKSMNQVAFSGFSELAPLHQRNIVVHVLQKENWARLQKSKKQAEPNHENMPQQQKIEDTRDSANNDTPVQIKVEDSKDLVPHSMDLVESNREFVMPVPGKRGAIKNILQGKTIVLTGVFPELGGGVGLEYGKGKARKLLERFGARVTGSVSGKTDILLVGDMPVSKARESEKCQLLKLTDIEDVIYGRIQLSGDIKPILIEDFSSGYHGNSLAYTASAQERSIASGHLKPLKKITAPSKVVKSKPKKKAEPKKPAKKQANAIAKRKTIKVDSDSDGEYIA